MVKLHILPPLASPSLCVYDKTMLQHVLLLPPGVISSAAVVSQQRFLIILHEPISPVKSITV